ncbi:MAG: folate-binding protein YgfZ [Gammaproteobacteria bacterium]|nr:folate-binding protein YgfZ [Gammaproteobacteria bacterium]
MSDWLDFLLQQGAKTEDQLIIHFGDPKKERLAARDGTVLCPLTCHGLLAARGEDSVTFLQGQFSNDIRNISVSHSQLNAYNSPKGRVLALMRVFRRDDAYFLRVHSSLFDAVLRRLRMFIMRAKVTLENESEKISGIGLSGPNAAELLAPFCATLPAQTNASVTINNYTIIRVAGTPSRFEIYAPNAALIALWQHLTPHATAASPGTWRWLDIMHGIPEVVSETSDTFVLQMINLHALDGVSFTKGCYTGQEIVARMYYLGKLKKRMYRAYLPGVTIPKPGMEIFESGTENDQSVGQVVDARVSPDDGCDVLAVIQVTSAEGRTLLMGSRKGPALELRELPYQVPLERQ